MKFLLDENIGKKEAKFLQSLGHIAIRIRLENESPVNKIAALKFALPKYVVGKFIVVEEKDGEFRIRPK